MVKKLGFGQMSHANHGLVFMPNRGLLAFLGFPESVHKLQSRVYAIPRSMPDIGLFWGFKTFLVSECLGDDLGWVRDVIQ